MAKPSAFLDDAILRCMVKPDAKPRAFEQEFLAL